MEKNTYTCLDMLMTGKMIKNKITKSGYRIRDIQEKLNLSCPQPVYRWMNGQVMPSLDNLYMLCRLLDVHMEDMLMPRDDELWSMYGMDNSDYKKRMMTYFGKFSV